MKEGWAIRAELKEENTSNENSMLY